MKVYTSCAALLVDVVGSRQQDRSALHHAVLDAFELVNQAVPALEPLRVTVGDELQGVYGALGEALAARRRLSTALLGTAELRFGIGGGEVRIIDAERGIQDGTAWWLAREAINAVEELAADPGYRTARTVIRDERDAATPGVDALVRLAEAAVARLRDGARRSFEGLLAGLPNEDVARAEDISPSANSQRVVNNDLRILADAVVALEHLP